jgi:hypothetical protein
MGFQQNVGKVIRQRNAIRAYRIAGDNADLAATDAQAFYRLASAPIKLDFGIDPFLRSWYDCAKPRHRCQQRFAADLCLM